MGGVSGAKSAANGFEDAFGVVEDVAVPEAQDAKALAFEPVCAFRVVQRPLRMLATVNFDNEPMLKADKVDDIRADRRLAAEATAIELTEAQMAP